MPYTKAESLAALQSLDPAPVFLDAYREPRAPDALYDHFAAPEELFRAPERQQDFGGGRLIPILDDGNFGLLTFLDPASRELVQIDVEEPQTERRWRSWQQYLATLMISIVELEDGVRGAATTARVAERIGFAHLDAVRAFVEEAMPMDADTWWEARDAFIERLESREPRPEEL